MAQEQYDRIIAAMPDIADAVNSFQSKSAQDLVLRTLLESLGAKPPVAPNPAQSNPRPDSPLAPEENGTDGNGSSTRRSGRKVAGRRNGGEPRMDDSLDIHPTGVESLQDFFARSGQKNQNEAILAIVYWLQEIAKVDTVGFDQVFTSFRLLGEKVPGSFGGKVSQTGSKGWLKDTKSNNVTLSVAGTNHVEHEMLKRVKNS